MTLALWWNVLILIHKIYSGSGKTHLTCGVNELGTWELGCWDLRSRRMLCLAVLLVIFDLMPEESG